MVVCVKECFAAILFPALEGIAFAFGFLCCNRVGTAIVYTVIRTACGQIRNAFAVWSVGYCMNSNLTIQMPRITCIEACCAGVETQITPGVYIG